MITFVTPQTARKATKPWQKCVQLEVIFSPLAVASSSLEKIFFNALHCVSSLTRRRRRRQRASAITHLFRSFWHNSSVLIEVAASRERKAIRNNESVIRLLRPFEKVCAR